MTTLRKGPAAACLTLLLAGCALAGPAQKGRADAGPTTQNVVTASAPSAPVVKIDRAMLQEREALPDGTVHLGTFLDAVPEKAAKSVPNAGSATLHAPAQKA